MIRLAGAPRVQPNPITVREDRSWFRNLCCRLGFHRADRTPVTVTIPGFRVVGRGEMVTSYAFVDCSEVGHFSFRSEVNS